MPRYDWPDANLPGEAYLNDFGSHFYLTHGHVHVYNGDRKENAMGLRRTHILLEPEQHQALVNIARRERRSVSDVTREIVQQGILLRQQVYETDMKRRLEAFEKARQVREDMYKKYGDKLLDIDIVILINEMRKER